jgi:hypothetical protein
MAFMSFRKLIMKEWIERTIQIYRNGNICSLQRLQLDDGICRNLLEYCAIAVEQAK